MEPNSGQESDEPMYLHIAFVYPYRSLVPITDGF
jgi:hypothetical protein